jgi:hypothetical protein
MPDNSSGKAANTSGASQPSGLGAALADPLVQAAADVQVSLSAALAREAGNAAQALSQLQKLKRRTSSKATTAVPSQAMLVAAKGRKSNAAAAGQTAWIAQIQIALASFIEQVLK